MQGGLQFRLVGAEPVILVHLHIEQDGVPGQVPGGDLDLDQPGGSSAIQPAADEMRQRLDPIDGLLKEVGRKILAAKAAMERKAVFNFYPSKTPK